MAKILYCGDAFVETGFGRVAENLLPALAEEHEVHVLAVNYWGDHDERTAKYKVYPAGTHGHDPFGSHRIPEFVQLIKPDLVWVTNDFWIGIQLWNQIKQFQEEIGFKYYCYTPIDSYGIFKETMPPVMEWDGLGTYTQFAAEELKKAGYDKHIDIISHGVDRTKFFPGEREALRKALGVPQENFIVFNGNRNQPRKRIDLTIKGFIKFAKDKPDAQLWLNMGKKDLGWDLVPLFKRVARDEGYDPTGKLILTSPHFDVSNCLSVEKLNQVYGAVDVGVNTCIGEGWGLVNFEHAAAGVAQVVPDHTSLKEIFNDIPRIECIGSETDRNYGLERPLPDPQSMADLLTMYYEDRNKLQATADWCYERVTSPEFSWDVIGKQMLGIVNRLLSTPKTKASGQGFGTPAKIV